MTTRNDFIKEALTWEGTPFHHQGRLKGVGVDCVGLIIGALKNVDVLVADLKCYPRIPLNNLFSDAVDNETVPVDLNDLLPGDLLKFRWTTEPQHLAIVIEVNPVRILHAHAQVRKCVISDFDTMWKSRFTDARRLKVFV